MGFFSDLKEDLSMAVNELIPEGAEQTQETEASEEDITLSLDEMLANIDSIKLSEDENETSENLDLDSVLAEDVNEEQPIEDLSSLQVNENDDLMVLNELDPEVSRVADVEETNVSDENSEDISNEVSEDFAGVDLDSVKTVEEALNYNMVADGEIEAVETNSSEEVVEVIEEAEEVASISKGETEKMDNNEARIAVDETSIITSGMIISGDIFTEGSLEVVGSVVGNIDVYGKLSITGSIEGDARANEIFADGAKVVGKIESDGAVKIGASSVIVGDIFATSAVIAGAIKGDIDVKGPVILDASAIVMGNVKSKAIQINNGAVIEGNCSQCYADVSPSSFFEEYKFDTKKRNK